MSDCKLLGAGLGGSALAAVCCFTPALALLLGVVGLSAWLAWLALRPPPGAHSVSRDLRMSARAEAESMTERQSTIPCPHCSHAQPEMMPTDVSQFFYDCKGCGVLLRPKPGACCVFCSYGSVPCRPMQKARTGR